MYSTDIDYTEIRVHGTGIRTHSTTMAKLKNDPELLQSGVLKKGAGPMLGDVDQHQDSLDEGEELTRRQWRGSCVCWSKTQA